MTKSSRVGLARNKVGSMVPAIIAVALANAACGIASPGGSRSVGSTHSGSTLGVSSASGGVSGSTSTNGGTTSAVGAGGAESVSGGTASTVGVGGAVSTGGGTASTGVGGAVSTGSGAASTGGASLGPDGFPEQCAEQIVLDSAATQRAHVQISLAIAGQPLVFGEPNALAPGGTLLPTNFRFYLSQFAVHRGDQRFAAVPIDPQGATLPYGVKLVNAEDMTSLELELLTLPGEYDSFSFILGLSQGCNQSFSPLNAPLDEASQLKWPHSLGFLFLRFEGIPDEAAALETPSKIHMGAAEGASGYAPEFRFLLPGDQPAALRLSVALDAIFEAASTEVDLSDFSLPPPAPPNIDEEILAGERLRRSAHSVEVFTLSASP